MKGKEKEMMIRLVRGRNDTKLVPSYSIHNSMFWIKFRPVSYDELGPQPVVLAIESLK